MLNVLSIQSDLLGHKTYSAMLRDYFSDQSDIRLDAYWYHDERDLMSRLIRYVATFETPLSARNVDLFRARSEWSIAWMSRRLAARKLAAQRYDVLHFHTQVQAFKSIDLMRTIPTVLTMDMAASQAAEDWIGIRPWTLRPNIAMERRAFAAAAHLVTFSDYARRAVIADHNIPASKVTTVPPGLNLKKFQEPVFEQHAKPRILFIGTDFERKGGWDLLDVFLRYFADRMELHLVTDTKISATHPSLFVHERVSAYSEPWHTLYRSADILVLASYAEAYGLVLAEAAANGLALIGSRVGAIPEIIVEGENGLLIPAGDRNALTAALQTLLDDPDLLMRMRRRSRELAIERHDARRNFQKLADIFKAVAVPQS